eukprot:CAMPEP_0117436050 /NCGR_PEP_ID=MMETSP0759-20121206/807_1 /TAXON_ID=63605 /ORGANISM="Percolomonas cosmopolitus, Strain WS" /LENGTH=977 /DNA_ID=CAMNT_0005227637 /DNA_START=44 /DNA_END=2974 /DNA_ORIENTATION=-
MSAPIQKNPPNIQKDLIKLYKKFPFYPKHKLKHIYAFCAHSLSDTTHLIALYHTKDKIDPEHIEWIIEKKEYVMLWCQRRIWVILDKLEDIWNKNGTVMMQLDSKLEELLDLEATLKESLIQKMVREQSEHFMEEWIVQVDTNIVLRDVKETLHNESISRKHAIQIRTWIQEARSVLEHMVGMNPHDLSHQALQLRVEMCYNKWMLWAGRRDRYVFDRFERLYNWGKHLDHEASVASALIYRGWFYCTFPEQFAQKSDIDWRRRERWTALFEEAFEWLHSGIDMTADIHERYLAYKVLGNTRLLHPDLEKIHDKSRAIGYYLQSLNLAQTIGYQHEELYLLEQIALHYDKERNSIKEALSYYKQAIELAQKFGDTNKVGHILNSIGAFYLEMRQLKFASDYLEQAERLIQGETLEMAQCYVNRARLLQRNGSADQAHVYYDKARKIYKRLDLPMEHIRMLHRIADTLVMQEDFNECMKIYLRAIDISLSCKDVEVEIETLARMAVVFMKKTDSSKAVKCLERAQSLSVELITQLEGTIPSKFMQQIVERCHQLKHIHILNNAHHKALQLAEMIKKVSKFHYDRHFDPLCSLDVHWLTTMHFPETVHFSIYYSIYNDTVYIFLLCATVPIYHPYAPKIIHVERVDLNLVLGNTSFEDLCKSLEKDCENLDVPRKRSLKTLSLLYQCLIQPIKQHLPVNSDQVVVIFTDPIMSVVPFSALYDMQNNVFLIEKHTLVVLPSIDAMHALEKKRKQRVFIPERKKKNRMLVVKCPKYRRAKYRFEYSEEKYTDTVDRSTMVDGSKSVKLGVDQCNIDDLRTTLTVFEPQLMHFSIRMSNDDSWPNMIYEHTGNFHFREEGIKDQLLKANEFDFDFYNLELLTLPACDVFALNRSTNAFFSKKVRAVLGTLWRSADGSCIHEILIGFYNHVCASGEENMSKAAALRRATVDFLAKHSDRRFDWHLWGGLQLSGDWHAFDRPDW